jgi:hypothetical protein
VNDVLGAALRLQAFCEEQQWRFCFIGGLAVQKWSEPRVTDDVDLTLMTGFGSEESFIDLLLAQDWLEPRIPNARDFAIRSRVLLLRTRAGVGIDIALGAFPFEQQATERALKVELLPNCALRLCTFEDLIVFKVFAGRPQDWRDVEMALVRRDRDAIDWTHIVMQLRPLLELKEQLDSLDRLEVLRQKVREAGSRE